jgi:hypothetical protein
MSLLKKSVVVIITVLFAVWGQLGAFQSSCYCSVGKQYQKVSNSLHSCCANQQQMINCHNTQSKQKTKSSCHNDDSKSGLKTFKQFSSFELCQSNCIATATDGTYYSGQTKTIDAKLFLNSISLTLIPADLQYTNVHNEQVFKLLSPPIFLLNASLLI